MLRTLGQFVLPFERLGPISTLGPGFLKTDQKKSKKMLWNLSFVFMSREFILKIYEVLVSVFPLLAQVPVILKWLVALCGGFAKVVAMAAVPASIADSCVKSISSESKQFASVPLRNWGKPNDPLSLPAGTLLCRQQALQIQNFPFVSSPEGSHEIHASSFGEVEA